MENLGQGFMLMLIGMLTVFVILLIVIYGSRGLIAIINKIAPEQAQVAAAPQASPAAAIDPTSEAVIKEAVAKLTAGKGHITKITRI